VFGAVRAASYDCVRKEIQTITRTIARRRLGDRFEPNEISIRSDEALSWHSFLKSFARNPRERRTPNVR
jgi:hypothetical protein